MCYVVNVWAAETQKIEILGRSVEPSFPREEEHRSFEDETVLLAGSGEAIQESLGDPSAEQKLEVLAAVARQCEELCTV
jgi:hypothetical protein